jgi:hypothetical protein
MGNGPAGVGERGATKAQKAKVTRSNGVGRARKASAERAGRSIYQNRLSGPFVCRGGGSAGSVAHRCRHSCRATLMRLSRRLRCRSARLDDGERADGCGVRISIRALDEPAARHGADRKDGGYGCHLPAAWLAGHIDIAIHPRHFPLVSTTDRNTSPGSHYRTQLYRVPIDSKDPTRRRREESPAVYPLGPPSVSFGTT